MKTQYLPLLSMVQSVNMVGPYEALTCVCYNVTRGKDVKLRVPELPNFTKVREVRNSVLIMFDDQLHAKLSALNRSVVTSECKDSEPWTVQARIRATDSSNRGTCEEINLLKLREHARLFRTHDIH